MSKPPVQLTLKEAHELGKTKLGITDDLFNTCVQKARRVQGMRPGDLSIMSLAFALMGLAKVDVKNIDSFQRELTDALSLIAKAEKEWRMEQALGARGRLH
jgi:hypothetical protein